MNRFFLFVFLFTSLSVLHSQTASVLWYNCENLFHPSDDSLKMDEAFTPNGDYHWTFTKYKKKVNSIGKVLLAVSGWEKPALIGLCEVEDEQCLKDLIYNSPLEGFGMRFLHRESSDRRGIDVALMYDPKQFLVLDTAFIRLKDANSEYINTRDILYAKGVLHEKDTMHILVNHWPSKYGGAVASEPRRIIAAQAVISITDSILNADRNAKILLMGDFNETYNEAALMQLSNAGLHLQMNAKEQLGSHKFHGSWSQIDYFILSDHLLNDSNGFVLHEWKIAQPAFALEPDKSYSGMKPFRTNIGFRYNGGFSDHLPLVLRLKFVAQ